MHSIMMVQMILSQNKSKKYESFAWLDGLILFNFVNATITVYFA